MPIGRIQAGVRPGRRAGRFVGSGEPYPGLHRYVDSVKGRDYYHGRSSGRPWKTLKRVPIRRGMKVGLAPGSDFHSDWDGIAAPLSQVVAFGADSLPIVSTADVVRNWTPEGTANVWQAPVTHDASGTDRLTVYESGALLTRQTSVANVSVNAGSLLDAKGSDGSPWTVKIRPTTGDPNGNRKVYTVSRRRRGVRVGIGGLIEGIESGPALGNNGSLELENLSIGRRLLARDGTKHNILTGGGLLEDVLAVRSDAVTSYEPSSTYFVGFANDLTGRTLTLRRCGAAADLGSTLRNTALIMHSSGASKFSTFTSTQTWCCFMGAGMAPTAFTVTVNAHYALNCNADFAGYTADSATLNYVICRQTHSNPTHAVRGLVGATTAGGARTFVFNNCVFFSINSSSELMRQNNGWDGETIEFNNCVIYLTGNRTICAMVSTDWGSGTFRLNNCILMYSSNTSDAIRVPTGVTYEGNNNVFLCNTNGGTNLNLVYQGTTYDTIADWRTATGQDANSLALGPSDLASLFSGTPANGDFTLGGAGAGAAAAAIGAGPQTHWDWNSRQAVPGPPTAWPVVPDTLAKARAYVRDPRRWRF